MFCGPHFQQERIKIMKILNVSFREVIFCILFFFVFAFLSENSVYPQPKEREYWPTSGWKASTPELQGMDSAKLSIAVEFIQNRLPDAYSLLVVKNGYLVYEKYFYIGSVGRSAEIRSVTKSITSTLIGIALEKGYINSAEQKLIEFFPEYYTDDLDPRKKEISLKNLLTMSAGFQWNNRGPIFGEWVYSPNRMKFAIQQPLANNPGEVFKYNGSLSHLLSGILTRSAKMSTLDFAKQHLFKPLGISVNSWRQDLQDYYYGGYGLKLTARDLLKIGYLFLNNGYWDGRSIVPETWVRESTRQHMHAFNGRYGQFGYGYQWWVKEVDGCTSYRAWGRRGQFIVVVPKLDLVIVVTSDAAEPHPPTAIHYTPLFDIVAAAVKRDRPPVQILHEVELPADVKAFLNNYNQAMVDKDIMKIPEFISDRFLNNGITKQRSLNYLSETTISYVSEAKVILTKFELEGNIAKVDGVIKDKYYQIPLWPEATLIKENGQWKWYGNQLPK